MKIDDVYYNFWGKQRPKFTEMELALMEGGHSLENSNEKTNSSINNNNTSRMQFIAGLNAKQVGPKSS